ncbi:SRPBCC family protein [Bacillus sp. ISL-40]|uniref:SRPBCC family protein n=1 Tax=unclassified Bacillus (in: firmicutes) TaxID=185979 RepID=UPI001BEBF5F8|nr:MULTISPECIES: SRPBCC family protein [unclassified Bacillus (in: firmicutes)]MBT2700727.1 SRPBCC family protein [Bacillus sp. ISL-40]MBT2719666.1 SRPBCC family protein [Bacillus sp. ISL-46]MBT2743544.1 SRPBCC family protein [Bacillus sp. ISL-77]
MYNLTKFKIIKPANEVFEAFVDPSKIKNFWFSSSSRWEQGQTVTLRYEEYDAQVDIEVIEVEVNKKIVFRWGTDGEGNCVTISLEELDQSSTIIEVIEEGFSEDDDELVAQLIDNKEGWVYMLTCLKGYLEFGIHNLRAAIVK